MDHVGKALFYPGFYSGILDRIGEASDREQAEKGVLTQGKMKACRPDICNMAICSVMSTRRQLPESSKSCRAMPTLQQQGDVCLTSVRGIEDRDNQISILFVFHRYVSA